MVVRTRTTAAFLVIGISLAAFQAQGADPLEELRVRARILASQEIPVAQRDLKGYCVATYGSADYASYAAHMCRFLVNSGRMKAEECSEPSIGQGIRKDLARCLAMSEGEFDKQRLTHGKLREAFVTDMKEAGQDGEKLLGEERAKLR